MNEPFYQIVAEHWTPLHLVCGDEMRPMLNYIHWDPGTQSLYASNGFILSVLRANGKGVFPTPPMRIGIHKKAWQALRTRFNQGLVINLTEDGRVIVPVNGTWTVYDLPDYGFGKNPTASFFENIRNTVACIVSKVEPAQMVQFTPAYLKAAVDSISVKNKGTAVGLTNPTSPQLLVSNCGFSMLMPFTSTDRHGKVNGDIEKNFAKITFPKSRVGAVIGLPVAAGVQRLQFESLKGHASR